MTLILRSKKIYVVLILCILSSACYGTKYTRLAQLSQHSASLLVKAQDAEINAWSNGETDDLSHKEAQKKFLLLAQLIKSFNSAIRIADDKGIAGAAKEIDTIISSFTTEMRPEKRRSFEVWITMIQTAIATILAFVGR